MMYLDIILYYIELFQDAKSTILKIEPVGACL